MDLKNKHILVVGLGKSGISVVKFLHSRGCIVTAVDNRSDEALGEVLNEIRNIGINIELGPHNNETFENCDLIVLSPGVPHTIAPLNLARGKKIPVIGEIELAYHFINIPIIAVTGTNGKSTTTLLIAEMLHHSNFKALAGGNLGTPLIELVAKQETADFIVLEISSFQLDTIDKFRPLVSIILNITDDHLERYTDFDAYARSKARIFKNQEANDICVFNEADETILTVSENLAARRFAFNCRQFNEYRAWISEQTICFYSPDDGDQHVDCTDIPLTGRHNLENVSAAGLAVLSVGGSIAGIKSALQNFKGLPHRVAYVDTVKNVQFYDDSKATNVDAVARALESFSSPVILIMGGRDKGGGYEGLRNQLEQCVKHLIVIGEAAEKIKSVFEDMVPTAKAADMAQAVKMAASFAVSGDSVLLSPACSSFDMYDSYAQRGNDFVRSIGLLKRENQ
ncbi:MAG: UDP-N-acetylmuramoyl-L-alanine--D-glutamate ligase [Desulfobacteraceae bacterium]|jgi:UDP-N-acetylmuramoylalanine--D-glutamate ligase|nr:UDP-N-acetylmuramoyl-L-alanine--D-glutamate ligase [Desulfobacteraceae bacterium]